MNIQFNYEYRDAGNYKEFGEVIFTNPDNLELSSLKKEIIQNLIDEVSFIAGNIKIPQLTFENENSDDHEWHNFLSIEITELESTDFYRRTIFEFIKDLKLQNYKKQLSF